MKEFEKLSTVAALETATTNLMNAKKAFEDATAAVRYANTRMNRKALQRAKIDLEHAVARVSKIELALAYQSENHNAKLRKPQIGEVLVKPSIEEKEVNAVVKKAETARKSVSMADAMEDYEKQCLWEAEKADKAEAKRIKREAKKALAEEIRKAKAIAAHAKREEEKAKAKEEKAEKVEAEKTLNLAVTPREATDMFKEYEDYLLLTESLADEVRDLIAQRDNLRADAKQLKNDIAEMSAKLKRPLQSVKVRKLMLEKETIEQKINAVNIERRNICAKAEAIAKQTHAMARQLKMLKKYGNAATRPTVRTLEHEFKHRYDVKEIDQAIRTLETIVERCKKDSFQIWSWDKETVLEDTGLAALAKRINAYKTGMKNGAASEALFEDAKKAVDELKAIIEAGRPLELSIAKARAKRIQKNMLSMCMKIDTEAESVRPEWISIEHGIFTAFNPSWKLFSSEKKDGQKMAEEFVAKIHELLDNVVIYWWDNTSTKYNGLYSSASHQKKETLISCKEELMKVHERLVWFGRTKAEVLASDVTGAEIWKMRANLARPIAFALRTKNGQLVYLHNILMVPDVKKNYHHTNAIIIGGERKNGMAYEFCEADNPTILGDGAILAMEEMERSAEQGGGAGVKGMIVFAGDGIPVAEAKRNAKVVLPEGKLLVCGDGCFKFDKLYSSYEEYAARMDEMSTRYPGINQVYALRESEEVLDEEKVRKVSRSLLQMLPVATDAEMHQLAKNTIDSLLYKKTFEGLFASLAELGVPEDKRSPFAQIVFECPMILTNAIVQAIGERAWIRKQEDAMGNRLRTKGQYPYIMQDIVALIEVWLLGADPDDPNLGVLKDGEASVVGVAEGTEMVAIRYPANFFTAKVVVCKPMKEIFGRCGNVAILSIHDDILIIQDGDVDGDEAGFFYDELLVKLVKRMRKDIKPPVVIFAHGDKASRVTMQDEATAETAKNRAEAKARNLENYKTVSVEDVLKKRMYSALYKAKQFDSVGKYANLARDCAYLACIEYRLYKKAFAVGDMIEANKHLGKYQLLIVQMAAASTGAILAIDQVKGNSIDSKLISWLDKIEQDVHGQMTKKILVKVDEEVKEKSVYAAPFTQPFNKNDHSIDSLEMNPLVNTDELAGYIYDCTGTYSCDTQGFFGNDKALASALMDNRHKLTQVRSNPMLVGVLATLRANYFNRPVITADGVKCNPDAVVFNAARRGDPVNQADLLRLFWRNANTLEFKMQAKTVEGKKREYYQNVHDSLIAQAMSYQWIQGKDTPNYELGHVFTDEEKLAAVVNNAIILALNLTGKGNGIDKENQPSFAKFVLNVFAKEIVDNVRRNNVDIRNFMDEHAAMVAIEEETGYEETNYNAFIATLEESYDASVLEGELQPVGDYNDDEPYTEDDFFNDYIPTELEIA